MDHNEIPSTFHLFCAALGDMPQTALSVNFRHIFSQEGRCGGEPFASDSVGIFGKSCFQSCRGKSTTPQQRVCIVTQPGIPTYNLWR